MKILLLPTFLLLYSRVVIGSYHLCQTNLCLRRILSWSEISLFHSFFFFNGRGIFQPPWKDWLNMGQQGSISSTFVHEFFARTRLDTIFGERRLANGVHRLGNFDLILALLLCWWNWTSNFASNFLVKSTPGGDKKCQFLDCHKKCFNFIFSTRRQILELNWREVATDSRPATCTGLNNWLSEEPRRIRPDILQGNWNPQCTVCSL
jgi:hypothetical protein